MGANKEQLKGSFKLNFQTLLTCLELSKGIAEKSGCQG